MPSLPALVDSLVALAPGTAAAEQPQHAIESLLMAALRSGGRQAGERLVDSIAEHGYAVERLDALPCMWRVAIPSPRVLEIWFTGGDNPVLAAVSYRRGKPWGTRAQKTAAKLQAEFYRRYERLAPQDTTLSSDDRLIQLVGEFEADVNNAAAPLAQERNQPALVRQIEKWLQRAGIAENARGDLAVDLADSLTAMKSIQDHTNAMLRTNPGTRQGADRALTHAAHVSVQLSNELVGHLRSLDRRWEKDIEEALARRLVAKGPKRAT
jgi:hypothetical protein